MGMDRLHSYGELSFEELIRREESRTRAVLDRLKECERILKEEREKNRLLREPQMAYKEDLKSLVGHIEILLDGRSADLQENIDNMALAIKEMYERYENL